MKKFKTLVLAIGIALTMVALPGTVLAGELGDTTADTTESVTGDTEDTASDTTSTESETTTSTTTTATTASQSDSSLATLGISPGTISPSFSTSVTEYYATLEAGTTEIKVFATPNSSAAGIAWVTGSKTLVDGENTVKVCCGAPNGNSTVYIIHVTVGSTVTTTTDTSTDTTTTGITTDAATDSNISTDSSTTTTAENEAATEELEEEASAIEDDITEETNDEDEALDGLKRVRAKLDSEGNLIYKKKVYSLNSDIPSGDYVSVEKYNGVYEQYQEARKKNTTIIIIAAVVAVVLIIVIINLIMRIKDKKEELETFYANEPFGEEAVTEPVSRGHREEQSRSDKKTKVPEPIAPNKDSEEKLVAKKPTVSDSSDDDIEFIDLD